MFALICSTEQSKKQFILNKKLELRQEVLVDTAAFYTKLLTEHPDNVTILTKAAYVFETMGENKRAEKILDKIEKLNGNNFSAKED